MIKIRENKITKLNQKYNKLTVISPEFKIKKDWWVTCECECGNICCKIIYCIVDNNTKSCSRLCTSGLIPEIPDNFVTKQGYLSATSKPYKDGKNWVLDMKCKCGWQGSIRTEVLLERKSQYHGGCKLYMKDKNWCGEISGRKWGQIASGAKLRNIKIVISREEAWELFMKQQGVCAVTGLKIYMSKESAHDGIDTASLDRIDNTQGYIKDNVWWVHRDVNLTKWQLTFQEYVDYCYLVNDFKNKTFNKLELQIFPHHKLFKGFGNISMSFWQGILNECIRRKSKNRPDGITCDVGIEDIWNKYVLQDSRCALTGIPIYHRGPGWMEPHHVKQEKEGTASLDRIDSNKGYENGNIQWLHEMINKMKQDYTEERFLAICSAVSDNNKHSDNIYKLLEPVIFNFDLTAKQKKYMLQKGPVTGKYKGVDFNKKVGRYRARFDSIWLGEFILEEEAAKNCDYHALKLHGTGCYLNFPNFDYSDFKPKRITL